MLTAILVLSSTQLLTLGAILGACVQAAASKKGGHRG